MKIIKGDILKSDADIICHQVNCMGVMGSGLAKQIRSQYPEVYTHYKQLCNSKLPKDLLGNTQIVEAHNGGYFANVFGQLKYGTDKQHTDYNALKNGLEIVAKRAKQYNESVAIPYGIGCGLGGGDWEFVNEFIKELFEGCDVKLYKFSG